MNKFNARRSGYELDRTFTKFVEITQCHRHYAVQGHSRSFYFSTTGKLIYDFLLVINTNLPPILHSFRVMVTFSIAKAECLTFTLSLRVIPCQYRRKWCVTKNVSIWPTFALQKVLVYPQPLLHNPPESYRIEWNYATVRAITPFTAIQCHRVWYQSKAHCDFLLVINSNLPPILHRFRDITSEMSKIAIFGYSSCV